MYFKVDFEIRSLDLRSLLIMAYGQMERQEGTLTMTIDKDNAFTGYGIYPEHPGSLLRIKRI